jgi:hypothetical protein
MTQEQISMEIFLGNGARLKFGSKREMNAFVAETNVFLTKVMVIANDLLVDTFCQSRVLWLISTNYGNGEKSFNNKEVVHIKSFLDSADTCLDKITCMYDQPVYSFIDLRKCFEFIAEALNILVIGFKKRNHTANYHSCMVLHDRATLCIDKLLKYAFDNINCTNANNVTY